MSTAANNQQNDRQPEQAVEREPALPLRSDTFLGVFEAIGQDLGINANWLRIPFAALLLWNPMVIIGSYLALGAVIAVTRWFFPVEQRSAAKAAKPETASNEEQEELAIAA